VTGTTSAGSGWDGPRAYALELPDGTVAPSHTVTVDFGHGYVDDLHVADITGHADPAADVVAGTAPPGGSLWVWVERFWGGEDAWATTQADGSGNYAVDFGMQGWDIMYGDEFHVYYDAPGNHWVEYWFWLAAPDLYVYKWNEPGHARPDGAVVYGIQYGNGGNGTAEDSVLVDMLPANTVWAGDTSGVTPEIGAGGVITWHLGDVDPGTHRAFMVTLEVLGLGDGDTIDPNCVAIATATPGDLDPGNNESCAGPVDVWDSDVEISVDKWPQPRDPTPGQPFEYVIRWCNERGAAVGPVWLTETLPVSTSLIAWHPENWWEAHWTEVTSISDGVVLHAPGLPGDMCQNVHLWLALDPEAVISTTLRNHVEIATPEDGDPENNYDVDDEAHVSPARHDVELRKRVFSAISVPGGWVEYFIDYWNNGNTATHVWITDTVPEGVSFGEARWGGGDQPNADEPLPEPTITGDELLWDLGELSVGQNRWFHVVMDIEETVPEGTFLVNCARATVDGEETTPQDNEDCALSRVYAAGQPDLYVFKELEGDYEPGHDVIDYRVEFGNSGDEPVHAVGLTETLPASSTLEWYDVEWDDWRGPYTVTHTADGFFIAFERIEPGWRGNLHLGARLDDPQAPLRSYTNTVEIDTPDDDANPANNTFTVVTFSGGEVRRVDVDVGGRRVWGCGYSGPVTVTTRFEERVYGEDCWDDEYSAVFGAGDVLTVAAGAGVQPVVIHIPDPFWAFASSADDNVWGWIDALDHEEVTVDLEEGPQRDVLTDEIGRYNAVFGDVPRGGRGEVRYRTMVDYADVTFHRAFQTDDLVVTVDYGDDYVQGRYRPGHTVWLTLTEGNGETVKAVAEVETVLTPEWGSYSGFETHGDDWTPPHPDIQPGDWMKGLVAGSVHTTSVRVGTIDAAIDADADTVSGTIDAPWLAPDPVTVWCEIHEENGESIRIDSVTPDGGAFLCDFGGLWDIQPGHNMVVAYVERGGDAVRTHPENPAPYLEIRKQAYGTPGEGGNVGFHIEYRNRGGIAAENVVITDTMEGMTYITDTLGIDPTGSGSGPMVWHLGTVAPTDFWIPFEVYAQVTEPASATVSNMIRIATSNPFDQGDSEEKEAGWEGHVAPNGIRLSVGKGAWTHDPAPGEAFVYTVDACNGGAEDVTDSGWTTVTDTLPVSTTLLNAWSLDPGWLEVTRGDHLLVWRHPSIRSHHCSRLYVRVQLTDTVEPGDELCNRAEIFGENNVGDPGDTEVTWCHQVGEPHTNVYVRKQMEWGRLVPGGEIGYEIQFGNSGNLPVENVVITDVLPAEASFERTWEWVEGQEWPLDPVEVTDDHVVWEWPTMPAGYNGTLALALRIDGEALPGDALTNTVEINHQPDEDSYADNSDLWAEHVNEPGPNLRVDKYTRWEGENRLFYGVLMKNLGTTTMEPIWITDTYPVSTTTDGELWIGHGPEMTHTVDPAKRQFVIWMSALDPGGTAHAGLWVDLDPAVQDVQGLIFTNTVAAPWPGDVEPTDNADTEVAYTGPDLYAEKWLSGGEPRPGERITFTVRCGNRNVWPRGVSEGATTVLTETLPTGTTYVTSTWPDGNPNPYTAYDSDAGVVTWDMGALGSPDNRRFNLVIALDSDLQGDDVLLNRIELQESPVLDVDPLPGNNSFELLVPVLAPRFELEKSYEGTRVAGMPVTYTLAVTNTGHTEGTDVVLSDTMPSGLTYEASDGTFDGDAVTWAIDSLAAAGGAASRWFRAALPCAAGESIVNEDYAVVGSAEGVSGPQGAAVRFDTVAPAIDLTLVHSPEPIVAGETVWFTATASTDGTALSYAWDFGSGPESGGLTGSHVYTRDGAHTVVFTATDGCGYEAATSTVVTVSAPDLVADFDYAPDPASILTDQSVVFTDTSTTDGPDITGWLWDFGDGAQDDGQHTSHVYAAAGTYTVTLAVTDALGYADTEVKPGLVTVNPRCTPLTSVAFVFAPTEPVVQASVTFTASHAPVDATAPITYVWDFGDGVTATLTSASVQHTYALSGSMSASVTAYNPCTPGGVRSAAVDVEVAPLQVYLPLVNRATAAATAGIEQPLVHVPFLPPVMRDR